MKNSEGNQLEFQWTMRERDTIFLTKTMEEASLFYCFDQMDAVADPF